MRAAGTMAPSIVSTRRSGPRLALPVLALRAYLRRLAGLARVMVPHAAIVALFLAFLTMTKVYSVIAPELPFWSVLVPISLAHFAISIGLLYAGMLLGGAIRLDGWRHTVALALGAAAGLCIYNFAVVTLTGHPWDTVVRWHIVESEAAWRANALWNMIASGLLLVVFYSTRDREASVARASRDAEVERALAQRVVVESRLKVMQARVEPEFLFDALADARRLYGSSPAEADVLLDDLIVYLRAALPHIRGETSTLGGEAALSAAYLAVTQAAREGRLRVEVRIAPDVAGLPFPPMVLLPLAQAVATAQARFAVIEARREGDDVRIAVRLDAAEAPPEWSDPRLAGLRETLAHYYGDRARIGTHLRDGDWAVEMQIPATPGLARITAMT